MLQAGKEWLPNIGKFQEFLLDILQMGLSFERLAGLIWNTSSVNNVSSSEASRGDGGPQEHFLAEGPESSIEITYWWVYVEIYMYVASSTNSSWRFLLGFLGVGLCLLFCW